MANPKIVVDQVTDATRRLYGDGQTRRAEQIERRNRGRGTDKLGVTFREQRMRTSLVPSRSNS